MQVQAHGHPAFGRRHVCYIPTTPLPLLGAARRYMVVLRSGGVYADVDTECRRPLDAVLHSKDTLVAGWDNEFAEARAALEAGCA